MSGRGIPPGVGGGAWRTDSRHHIYISCLGGVGGKTLFRVPESEAARCIDSQQLFRFGSRRQKPGEVLMTAKLLDDSEPHSH